MPSRSSLSRLGVLLITLVSPALLGFVKCVFVSNPTVATARIERIEPINPIVGEVVRVSGTGTGTPPLLFTWDFGDGTVVADGMQAAHVYLAPIRYRITFTVRDANGNAARDEAQIAVGPGIPTPKVVTSTIGMVLVSHAIAGQPTLFAAMPLEESAGAASYLWTFSDGKSAAGQQVAATFLLPGMYSAAIATTNDRGEIAVTQISFHVDQR
jgi:PKD domain-containing protein